MIAVKEWQPYKMNGCMTCIIIRTVIVTACGNTCMAGVYHVEKLCSIINIINYQVYICVREQSAYHGIIAESRQSCTILSYRHSSHLNYIAHSARIRAVGRLMGGRAHSAESDSKDSIQCSPTPHIFRCSMCTKATGFLPPTSLVVTEVNCLAQLYI